MAAYHGPSSGYSRLAVPSPAPADPERVKQVEKETALHLAMHSTDPTVTSTLDRLLVAVRLAHGEDFAAKRRIIRDASEAMRAEYVAERAEMEREKIRLERERDYNRTMRNARWAVTAMFVVAALFIGMVASSGG